MEETSVSVDYYKKINNYLFKKFHMFNSGMVPYARYERDTDVFDNLYAGSLRIDIFMGEKEREIGNLVDGDIDNITYNYHNLDRLIKFMNNKDILPYISWCYIPLPLQPQNTDFREGPVDYEKYKEILANLSKHYKDCGLKINYHEVYNEPDCNDIFFKGNFREYLDVYEYGVKGIKEGDPDAFVGGPSGAFVQDEETIIKNFVLFLDKVDKENLPLDFFSYHSYGYEKKEYSSRTELVEKLISNYNSFNTVELHMNELNVIPPTWEYGKTDLAKSKMLPLIFTCINDLVSYTDLTIINWAQLLNSGVDELSIVDINGNLLPAYYAFEIYTRMPIERHFVNIKNDRKSIKSMASSDESRCSAVFWNETTEKQKLNIALEGLKGEKAEIYKLDNEFFNKNKDKSLKDISPQTIKIQKENLYIDETLDVSDILYIETNLKKNKIEKNIGLSFGRKYHYFQDRQKDNYGWFEKTNQTAYLGMGKNEQAFSLVGITIENAPDEIHLKTVMEDVLLSQGEIVFRIDLKGYSGYYMSIVYTNRSKVIDEKFPWGTKLAPQKVFEISNLSELKIDLSEYRCEEFTGEVILSFALNNAGENARMKSVIK